MKRQRPTSWNASRGGFLAKRPRGVYRAPAVPKRAYPQSRVPLASRGYRLNNVEKKVADTATASTINTDGAFILLASPTPGTDMTNRIGRKIILKSVYLRGYMASEAALNAAVPVAQVAQQMRMILFIDYQPNGAAPAITDLLKTAAPSSQLNLNNRDRFKILKDKTIVVDPYFCSQVATQSICSTSNQIQQFKVYKKLNLETVLNAGTAGTIADISSGAVYLCFVGSEPTGSNNDGLAIWTGRVRFSDP